MTSTAWKTRVAVPARRPGPGRGAIVVGLLAALGLVALWALELSPAGLVPRAGGRAIAADFFSAAWQPATEYEGTAGIDGSFLLEILSALYRTVIFAAAAMSLALVAGTVLGFLASSTWWAGDPALLGSPLRRFFQSWLGPLVQGATRILIVGQRSVHELLWALLFLAAFGLNTASAVVAIAIPFTGMLAKVFSELLDETDPESAHSLRAVGASPIKAFLFGTLPRALPDMSAYAFYRLEGAVRSSAILGFFGYPTIGYSIRLSFENLHYREVWSYLWALIILVLCFEAWSAALRRRFVA